MKSSLSLRVWIAILLPAVLLVNAFSQRSKERDIPFETSRNFALMLVKADVNGNSGVLVVDTGSNRTIVGSELVGSWPRALGNVGLASKGSGLTGAGVFTTATLRVGPITWRDHRVLAMNMKELSKSLGQEINGVLGMDFLTEFGLVVIDSKHHKLVLSP